MGSRKNCVNLPLIIAIRHILQDIKIWLFKFYYQHLLIMKKIPYMLIIEHIKDSICPQHLHNQSWWIFFLLKIILIYNFHQFKKIYINVFSSTLNLITLLGLWSALYAGWTLYIYILFLHIICFLHIIK